MPELLLLILGGALGGLGQALLAAAKGDESPTFRPEKAVLAVGLGAVAGILGPKFLGVVDVTFAGAAAAGLAGSTVLNRVVATVKPKGSN